MKIIIADTSSLILFSKIQKLDILKDLFNDVQITPEAEVITELENKSDGYFEIAK